jgi:chemotaxis response regulator CheB
MRDLVISTIAEQPDIEVVGEVLSEAELTHAVDEIQPDVLIIALEDPEERKVQCGFLLGRYPAMRILALAPEQNRAIYYWASIDVRTRSMESSEAGILNAVRERPAPARAIEN